MARDTDGLNPRQARFVQGYTGGGPKACFGNATRSAKWAGYSERTAESQGVRLLGNAKVAARIAARQAQTEQRAQVTREDLVRRFLEISDLKLSDITSENGSLLPIHEWPEAAQRSVQGVETIEVFEGRGENRVKIGDLQKVKLGDRGQNLERVAKILGMLVERIGNADGTNLAAAVIYLPRGGGDTGATE